MPASKRPTLLGAIGNASWKALKSFGSEMQNYMTELYRTEEGSTSLHDLIKQGNIQKASRFFHSPFVTDSEGIPAFLRMIENAIAQPTPEIYQLIAGALELADSANLNSAIGSSMKVEISKNYSAPEIQFEYRNTLLHVLALHLTQQNFTTAQKLALRIIIAHLINKGADPEILGLDKISAVEIVAKHDLKLMAWFQPQALAEVNLVHLPHLFAFIDKVENPIIGVSVLSELAEDIKPLIAPLLDANPQTLIGFVNIAIEFDADQTEFLVAQRDLVSELKAIINAENQYDGPTVVDITEEENAHNNALQVIFSNLNSPKIEEIDDQEPEIEIQKIPVSGIPSYSNH